MNPVAMQSDGRFEGYASVFFKPDLGRDIVMPGAFRASLARKPPRDIRLLFQHDPAQPVGIWLDLHEDGYGLYCRGALNLAVQRGRELDALLRQGALDGLSIGFKALRADRLGGGGRRLVAVDLWEISLVSFPLLVEARVSAFKSSPSGDHMFDETLRTRARALFSPA